MCKCFFLRICIFKWILNMLIKWNMLWNTTNIKLTLWLCSATLYDHLSTLPMNTPSAGHIQILPLLLQVHQYEPAHWWNFWTVGTIVLHHIKVKLISVWELCWSAAGVCKDKKWTEEYNILIKEENRTFSRTSEYKRICSSILMALRWFTIIDTPDWSGGLFGMHDVKWGFSIIHFRENVKRSD